MDSPSPAPWTFAARAAYFGDRVCAFCDGHNPAGAKFCNDCGSPLHLKPCIHCAAANEQAATCCCTCGREYPKAFTAAEAPTVLPIAEPAPAPAVPANVRVGATAAQPALAAPKASRAGLRVLGAGNLAAIATILIVGAYAAYSIGRASPDAPGVVSETIAGATQAAPAVLSAAPMATEPDPEPVAAEPDLVEPETTPPLRAPILTTRLQASKRSGAAQRPRPGQGAKGGSPPQQQARVATSARVTHTVATSHVRSRVAKPRKAQLPDALQLMNVSLAQCGSGLITRMVCDQRVRRRFCEGRWGAAPECASGITNDRGQ